MSFSLTRGSSVSAGLLAGERRYLLPIMTCLVISKTVGDYFNISLYDLHVEHKCVPFVEDLPPTGMEQLVAVRGHIIGNARNNM